MFKIPGWFASLSMQTTRTQSGHHCRAISIANEWKAALFLTIIASSSTPSLASPPLFSAVTDSSLSSSSLSIALTTSTTSSSSPTASSLITNSSPPSFLSMLTDSSIQSASLTFSSKTTSMPESSRSSSDSRTSTMSASSLPTSTSPEYFSEALCSNTLGITPEECSLCNTLTPGKALAFCSAGEGPAAVCRVLHGSQIGSGMRGFACSNGGKWRGCQRIVNLNPNFDLIEMMNDALCFRQQVSSILSSSTASSTATSNAITRVTAITSPTKNTQSIMFSSIASSTTTSNAVTRVTAITSPAINTLATIPVITTAKFITGVGSTSQFIPPALATIARPNDLDVSPIPGNALATTSNPSSNFPAAVPENIPMDDQAVSTDVNPSDEPVAQEITSQPSQLNLSICKGKPDFSTLCLGPTKHVTCVGEDILLGSENICEPLASCCESTGLCHSDGDCPSPPSGSESTSWPTPTSLSANETCSEKPKGSTANICTSSSGISVCKDGVLSNEVQCVANFVCCRAQALAFTLSSAPSSGE